MIAEYLNQIVKPLLIEPQIKAFRVPCEIPDSYIFYDFQGHLHYIIKTNETLQEHRRGITVQSTELNIINVGPAKYLDFKCSIDEFKDKFILITDEIIEKYRSTGDLVKSIRLTINKWYYFFEKENSNVLNENQIKGLIGELIFINRNDETADIYSVIRSWKGPEGAIKDFSFGTFDTEVKTSTREEGHIHHINGELQLQTGDNPLYVYSLSLKKSDSANSVTLKKLTDEILMKIAEDPFILNEFFEKLELQGVLATETSKYDVYKFEIRNEICIKITSENQQNFIIENQNNRISKIGYDFDFNGLDSEFPNFEEL